MDTLPMVRRIVSKIAGQMSQQADMDELISAGTLGLVKAARAYDPSHDAEFRTYAYIRIRGAVIDELRSRSFVPVAVHGEIKRMQEAYRRLSSVHNRPPGDEELASEMGIATSELYSLMEEARRRHFLHIHGLSDEPSAMESLAPVDRGPSPQSQVERQELAGRLAAAIASLPQRDRHILLLYYERELTMKEVAAVLRVTESRVSQLHASALMKLAMKMKE